MKTNLRYKRWSHPLLWGLTCLLALFVGAGGAKAQVSVTVGSQVTDVANIVSGKAYLLRWDGLTGTPLSTLAEAVMAWPITILPLRQLFTILLVTETAATKLRMPLRASIGQRRLLMVR